MLMHVKTQWKYACAVLILILAATPIRAEQRSIPMEVTAYCDCGDCNGYTRGRWLFLKLDVWNKYVDYGSGKGDRYTDETAGAGDTLVEPRAGLLSSESIKKPWTVPGKVLLPWRMRQRWGTIAADTDYYPFGTRMYVPGWGWGVVQDVGGAIKGPNRLDIFFSSHGETEDWGRQDLNVTVDYGG